jgi:hypothetical protein
VTKTIIVNVSKDIFSSGFQKPGRLFSPTIRPYSPEDEDKKPMSII